MAQMSFGFRGAFCPTRFSFVPGCVLHRASNELFHDRLPFCECRAQCESSMARQCPTRSSQWRPSAYGQQKEPGSSVEPAVSLDIIFADRLAEIPHLIPPTKSGNANDTITSTQSCCRVLECADVLVWHSSKLGSVGLNPIGRELFEQEGRHVDLSSSFDHHQCFGCRRRPRWPGIATQCLQHALRGSRYERPCDRRGQRQQVHAGPHDDGSTVWSPNGVRPWSTGSQIGIRDAPDHADFVRCLAKRPLVLIRLKKCEVFG
jgi:hypothetical protein